MRLSARLLVIRADLTTRRAARELRRQLERDLGCFVTARERDDLLATFDRYPESVTAEARELLDRGARRDAMRQWPVGRYRA